MSKFKRTSLAASISLLLCSAGANAQISAAECLAAPFVENQVLVKFAPNASTDQINLALQAAGAKSISAFPLVQQLDHPGDLAQWRTVTLNKNIDTESAIAKFRHISGVAFIEPDYVVELDAIRTPNDDLSAQWALSNNGGPQKKADSDIDALEAWTIETGSADVIVAVIDTGIDYNHQDLADNIWVNAGEIAGNGIDDDNNGFIDDVRGWDWGDSESDPMDVNGHGSHVAGIIGAVANNGVGISGVAQDVSLMPLKMFADSGSSSSSKAMEAIIYAIAQDADIINASWSLGSFSAAVESAIATARDNGILFVSSAGNNGNNNDSISKYPSTYNLDNIISVANSNALDNLHTSSNYGAMSIDLAAPGQSIRSAGVNNQYIYQSGTSMAAPHVAGTAALLKSQDPNREYSELKALLMESVDKRSSFAGKTVTGGRLNAHAALLAGQAALSTYGTMFIRGTNNSWDATPMLNVSDYTWQSVIRFTSGSNDAFKFDVAGDWATSFGDNNSDNIAELGGSNIAVSNGTGDYVITLDTRDLSYTVSKISPAYGANQTSMYLRASSNNFTPVAMTLVGANVWEAPLQHAQYDVEFNFDVYGEDSTVYGDTDVNNVAELAGANIVLTTPGAYTIQFNDNNLTYSVLQATYSSNFTALSVRGSNNDWGNTQMDLVADNVWMTIASFNSGTPEFKFDRYSDWASNFGDNNADGYADQNGSNIVTGGDGDFLIRFNDQTMAYTVEKVDYAKTTDKMFIRGTLNSWGADEMSLAQDYVWHFKSDFTGNPNKVFKFSVYGDWTIGYGDNDKDGYAEINASDIHINGSTSVIFDSYFDINTLQYTSIGL